ncbi:hypothetical protein ACFOGJ_25230 [Marinibaculum pumilum]|uniref:Uncharacterized protein n=1 Tax=Marinibaculum pumilum TaxID=1766165 RepID=A0ABV7L7E2_9PROT
MKDLWPAMTLAALAIVGLGVMTISPAADARQVAAVFPPWFGMSDRMQRLAAVEAVALDEGAWGNIVLVSTATTEDRADLLAAGAWFLLDPRALRGCFTSASALASGRS